MSLLLRRVAVAAALGAAATAACPAAFASGSPGVLPTVSVRPAHLDPNGPNRGQWFVFDLKPGQSGKESALLVNVANVPEIVTIYTRDLAFSANGSPQVLNTRPTDVGAWVHLGAAEVRIPSHQGVIVPFTVTVPAQAVPGDHIGVLVVQSQAQRVGTESVIERVATRLYVTVPGHVTPSMALGQVATHVSGPLWPHTVTVDAVVRNTGRIRVTPTLRVNGHVASGSSVLLAQSAELYRVRLPLHWWGGHLQITVAASAPGLPTRVRVLSIWVINWVLIAMALLALLALTLLGMEIRRRRQRAKQLKARLADLESRVAPAPAPQAAVSR